MPVHCAAESADLLPFLRAAAQGACLATHEDLWRWLRGEVLSGRVRLDDSQAQALKLLVPFIDTALRCMDTLPASATDTLSERERQIMEWVAKGKTNPEIGCILRISEFTVKNHLKSIFSKLDVSNRAQAVARLTHPPVHA